METLSSWKQFTVYPPGSRNKAYPVHALDRFLPEFIKHAGNRITLWHFLFEPSCLVRFQSTEPRYVLAIAEQVAKESGLVMEEGDIATISPSPSGATGVDYPGEADYYGEDLWQANAKFLDACAGLSLELNKSVGEEFLKMATKHVHLLLNTLGMNAAEEAVFHNLCAHSRQELYREYRTQ
jgi:hypothetical protein